MRVSDFDYRLPTKLIAQYPLKIRDHSRLMVVDRSREKIYHKRFPDLIEFVKPNDLIVMNNSKVFPAKLYMEKLTTGVKMEGLVLSKPENNIFSMRIKNSKRLPVGSTVLFTGSTTKGKITEKKNNGVCSVEFLSSENALQWLERYGSPPLPHYIKRTHDSDNSTDNERYQTIYAKAAGSIAAPTAGLHFTRKTMTAIRKKGVKTAEVTLHVGYATFKPIRAEQVEQHTMEKEEFYVPKKTAACLVEAKKLKKKVVAVGTTVARTLESYALQGRSTAAGRTGETAIFIYPGYRFKLVDALLTNFHLPKSTLLMLVCAFAGKEFTLSAYEEAIRKGYRFYSYGDAMLII